MRLFIASICLASVACGARAQETHVTAAVRVEPKSEPKSEHPRDKPADEKPARDQAAHDEVDDRRARCMQGDADVCNTLAIWLERHGGTEAESYALYERACAGGIAAACTNQAIYLANGYAVPIDTVRAAALLRKTCDTDHYARACSRLADATETGAGVPKDAAAADKLQALACNLGDGDACASHGYNLAHGKSDVDGAVKAYDRGCRLDDGRACHNLAVMFADGRGVVANDRRASELYARACALGYETDCKN